MADNFSHLMSPGRIGSMELRNRIFMTAMASKLCEDDGSCGERVRAYYEARAKGGAALITLGSVAVAYPIGTMFQNQAAVSDDKYIPGLRALADAVHKHGTKLSLQLHFGGLVGIMDTVQGRPQYTPSIPKSKPSNMAEFLLEDELQHFINRRTGEATYKEMTDEDIGQMVSWFVEGAVRARKAGADAVEIHGGHGYIISSFLSPLTNHRTDKYGGSVENRSRLLIEILSAVRVAVGSDFPILCKLDTETMGVAGGVSPLDARLTAQMAQDAGADAIVASAYHDTSRAELHISSHTPHQPDLLVANAAAMKACLDIPVVTQGRIEPASADRYIREGQFDFVAMGRKLLADPELPNKLGRGRPAEIRPCIYCYTCNSQSLFGNPIKCAVNTYTGHELNKVPLTTHTPKRIVVIGGGPAGMQSAWLLSEKGHSVTLIEQSDRLGGTLQFASIAYEPNERLLHWLKHGVAHAKVDVRLKTTATIELLRSLAPDEVIVATGATRTMPPIPGADADYVLSGEDMRSMVLGQNMAALEAKLGTATRLALKLGSKTGLTKNLAIVRKASDVWMPLGQQIVIIGGDLVGLELAEFLAHRHRQVTVIDEAARFGSGLQPVRRFSIFGELKELGVTLLPGAREIRIGNHQVSYIDAGHQTRHIAADHIVVAKGASGDLTLANKLRDSGFTVHVAGDCDGIGYIENAITSAVRLAEAI